MICGGPNPEKRPNCMKGEETDPSARVNGILVGVIPRLGHVIGDVVNRDHPVSEDQDDKEKDGEGKIAQKVHGGQLLSVKASKWKEHREGYIAIKGISFAEASCPELRRCSGRLSFVMASGKTNITDHRWKK
jgi:hypothetical protein